MNERLGKLINVVNEVGEVSIEATVGAVAGGALGGVGGAIVGSLAGKAFGIIGKEIKERVLSHSENKKISTVFECAKNKIEERLDNGAVLRQDGFFDEKENNRSAAVEILEGVLFTAQKEYEEKKLEYMANFYANICFDESISREVASYLIKIAAELTYREIVILSIIGKQSWGVLNLLLRDYPYKGFDNYHDMGIAAEVYELYRKSLIISSSAILDSASFTPAELMLNGMGELLFVDMELYSMPLDLVANDVIAFLQDDITVEKAATVMATLPIREEVEAILDEVAAEEEASYEVAQQEDNFSEVLGKVLEEMHLAQRSSDGFFKVVLEK